MPQAASVTASSSPSAAASAALKNGLVYVNPEMPGYKRFRRGEHFRFKDVHGRWVTDKEDIARIRRLAIPPAYESVWICPLPNGHLQATGIDARGRKQYRYHPEWRLQKDEVKFERLEAFGKALPRIRRRVQVVLKGVSTAASRSAHSKEVLLATLVRLLDTTYLRIGNEEYAETNKSYGLTTLKSRHAAVRGGVLKLRFRGKSGVDHEAAVEDPRVARVIRSCQQLPGQDLFQYIDDEGERHTVTSTDVNDFIREASGDEFTAKDFRTWHGTVQALELTRLACSPSSTPESTTRYNAKAILTAVSQQLGNTPAVCKKAYIHPAVLALGGSLASDAGAMAEIWKKIAGKAGGIQMLYAPEVRLLRFLESHKKELKNAARDGNPFILDKPTVASSKMKKKAKQLNSASASSRQL